MDVYVLYWQDYEEVDIMGVFPTLKAAVESCESQKKPKSEWGYDDVYQEWWVSAKKDGEYRISKHAMTDGTAAFNQAPKDEPKFNYRRVVISATDNVLTMIETDYRGDTFIGGTETKYRLTAFEPRHSQHVESLQNSIHIFPIHVASVFLNGTVQGDLMIYTITIRHFDETYDVFEGIEMSRKQLQAEREANAR